MRKRHCIWRRVPTYTYYSLLPVPHYYLAESISEEAQKTEKAAFGVQLIMELQIAFKCRYSVCACDKEREQVWMSLVAPMHKCVHTCESRATKHMKSNLCLLSIICKLAEIGFQFHCVLHRKPSFSVALHCYIGNTYFSRVVFGARHFEKTLVQGQVVSYRVLQGKTDGEKQKKRKGRRRRKTDKEIFRIITIKYTLTLTGKFNLRSLYCTINWFWSQSIVFIATDWKKIVFFVL